MIPTNYLINGHHRYHHLKVPLRREFWDIPLMYAKMIEPLTTEEGREELQKLCDKVGVDSSWVLDHDFQRELRWCSKANKSVGGRQVLSLWDSHNNNVLVRKEPDVHGHRATLIDYETSCWSWRGHDIGNYWNFWLFDVAQHENNFQSKTSYPSEAVRRKFITDYLEEVAKVADFELDHNGYDTVDHVLMEAEVNGVGALHFMMMAVMDARVEGHTFNEAQVAKPWVHRAKTDIELYKVRKQEVIEKYGLDPDFDDN